MKKTTITIILLLVINLNSFSQELNDSLVIDFFNKTFYDYFITQDTLTQDFYILKDSVPYGVETNYKDFKLHLIDYSQAYPLIKKEKISSLYRARLKQISIDTIDIVIIGWTVEYKRVFRFRKINGKRRLLLGNYKFKVRCGGTLGYIPQGRIVYSSENNKWNYIPEKKLIDDKMKIYNINK